MLRQKLLLGLLIFVAALAGCGRKGPVRPLLKAEPTAPARLEAQQVGDEIVLRFDLPQTNQDGSPLTDLAALRVSRSEIAAAGCSDCGEPTGLWLRLDTLATGGDKRRGTIRDRDVRPGFTYRYRIVAEREGGLTGAAASVSRTMQPILAAPTAVAAAGFDRMIRISWAPPSPPEGYSPAGCNVYRAAVDAPFGPAPLSLTPVTENRFDDVGVVNGVLWRYQVRCLARQGNEVIEGLASEPVSAAAAPEN